LAMLCAVKNYKAIITMPDKMSLEKKYILNSMGAECIRCPSDAPFNTPESHIGLAVRLSKELENSLFLDQYSDDSNGLANYDETAEELWNQLEGKVDYIVMTAGTGGTITGIARKFKERNPNVKIVGVDPVGSKMAYPPELNYENQPFKVEGIGYDFVPKNLDQESVDIWYKSEDKDSFIMARRIISEEGILAGGSSGSALWAAIDLAKKLPEDKRICVVFCDGIRNYMTKFISDDWMIENCFFDEKSVEEAHEKFHLTKTYGQGKTIKELITSLDIPEATNIDENQTVEEVFNQMQLNKVDYMPVVRTENQTLLGVASLETITQKLLSGFVKPNDMARRVIQVEYKKLDAGEAISRLSKAFKNKHFVYVKDGSKPYILTPKDLVKFISNNGQDE